MKLTVVEPGDPAGDRFLYVIDGHLGAFVENGGAHVFGFAKPVDALHQGIIVGFAHVPDQGCKAIGGKLSGLRHRNILRFSVRICPQLLGLDQVALSAASSQAHPPQNHYELDTFAGQRMPIHDASGEHIDDEHAVEPPSPCLAIPIVHHLGVIRARGGKSLIKEVAGADAVFGGNRGGEDLVAADARQPERTHGPVDRSAGCAGVRGSVDQSGHPPPTL